MRRKKPLAARGKVVGASETRHYTSFEVDEGIANAACATALTALVAVSATNAQPLPRTPDGKPDLQGIWQAQSRAAYGLEYHAAKYLMPAGPSVIDGGEIPYLPAAREQQRQNFENRATADPLNQCYMPGVPRIMYLEHPFQIFQTRDHVAITFEWSQVFRLIYANGQPTLHEGIESWMGNSRGRWEGDVLVVEVTDHNDRTWLDAAGNFHSNALRVTERYALRDANTIEYSATIEDPNVFSRPWTIRVPLHRETDLPRLYEYHCLAEKSEASGDFERDPLTWFPGPSPAGNARFDARAGATLPDPKPRGAIRRLPDGKPDISGWFEIDAGGGNYGLESSPQIFLTPASRGLVVDPADGKLPYQTWRAPSALRARSRTAATTTDGALLSPESALALRAAARAHPSAAGLRRGALRAHVVAAHRDERPSAAAGSRSLVAGDSQGRWEGDTLSSSKNFNGKRLNEVGDIVSHGDRRRAIHSDRR
jgi:hypothetical protein